MRCCHIVASLEERHGGPSKSALALALAQAHQGHQVELLATHPRSPDTRHEGTLDIRIFRRNAPQALCPSYGLQHQLSTSPCDVVHHHALWLRTLHYAHRHAAQRGIPLVISPRGMMNGWAWHHHRVRKRVAEYLIHPGALAGAAGWHATSAEEAEDIAALGFKQPICIAPNGVTAPSTDEQQTAREFWFATCPSTAERPVALFYSRFHRKKRVLELIDLWLARRRGEWLLLIIGLEDEYTTRDLEGYVMRCSAADRVRIFNGEGVPPPYAIASIFLLPSHSENFGLAIAEAMAYRVPVVVTDSTPWSQVNPRGAGWCVPWETYPAALEAALDEDAASRAQRGAAAREFVLANYSWDASAHTLETFYHRLQSGA